MRNLTTMTASLVMTALLVACGGEERAGQPETETTGTTQAASQTSSATATTTGASGGTVSDLAPADKEFVSDAGMAGLAEVQMANLALQKAVSADVRSFAQQMVTDHSASNAELAHLATAKGLALPTELAGEAKSGLDHLSSISGAEFDSAYMQHMVADHEKAVSLFDRASTAAGDADIKAFANKMLPTLQGHQTRAREIAQKM